MAQVKLRRLALQDLVRIEMSIREEDAERATRFRRRVRESMSKMAEAPLLGAPFKFVVDDREIRWFLIARFRKYGVLYSPLADGIDVLRVMHVAQDISAVLLME